MSDYTGFAIIHLLRNQKVQQKMQAELDEVCGDSLPTLGHRPWYGTILFVSLINMFLGS